ncbi:unnamed protein product, partial [Amoebophrya sp. A120]
KLGIKVAGGSSDKSAGGNSKQQKDIKGTPTTEQCGVAGMTGRKFRLSVPSGDNPSASPLSTSTATSSDPHPRLRLCELDVHVSGTTTTMSKNENVRRDTGPFRQMPILTQTCPTGMEITSKSMCRDAHAYVFETMAKEQATGAGPKEPKIEGDAAFPVGCSIDTTAPAATGAADAAVLRYKSPVIGGASGTTPANKPTKTVSIGIGFGTTQNTINQSYGNTVSGKDLNKQGTSAAITTNPTTEQTSFSPPTSVLSGRTRLLCRGAMTEPEPELALAIQTDAPEFKYDGTAWSVQKATDFGSGNFVTDAYFKPASTVILSMNANTVSFDLKKDQKQKPTSPGGARSVASKSLSELVQAPLGNVALNGNVVKTNGFMAGEVSAGKLSVPTADVFNVYSTIQVDQMTGAPYAFAQTPDVRHAPPLDRLVFNGYTTENKMRIGLWRSELGDLAQQAGLLPTKQTQTVVSLLEQEEIKGTTSKMNHFQIPTTVLGNTVYSQTQQATGTALQNLPTTSSSTGQSNDKLSLMPRSGEGVGLQSIASGVADFQADKKQFDSRFHPVQVFVQPQGPHLALEILDDEKDFRYAGAAWDEYGPKTIGKRSKIHPGYNFAIKALQVEQNGKLGPLLFLRSEDQGKSLRDLLTDTSSGREISLKNNDQTLAAKQKAAQQQAIFAQKSSRSATSKQTDRQTADPCDVGDYFVDSAACIENVKKSVVPTAVNWLHSGGKSFPTASKNAEKGEVLCTTDEDKGVHFFNGEFVTDTKQYQQVRLGRFQSGIDPKACSFPESSSGVGLSSVASGKESSSGAVFEPVRVFVFALSDSTPLEGQEEPAGGGATANYAPPAVTLFESSRKSWFGSEEEGESGSASGTRPDTTTDSALLESEFADEEQASKSQSDQAPVVTAVKKQAELLGCYAMGPTTTQSEKNPDYSKPAKSSFQTVQAANFPAMVLVSKLTQETCSGMCGSFPFFGLYGGDAVSCRCGDKNATAELTKVDDVECSKGLYDIEGCNLDAEYCGATDRIAVYSTSFNRVLTEELWTDGADLTGTADQPSVKQTVPGNFTADTCSEQCLATNWCAGVLVDPSSLTEGCILTATLAPSKTTPGTYAHYRSLLPTALYTDGYVRVASGMVLEGKILPDFAIVTERQLVRIGESGNMVNSTATDDTTETVRLSSTMCRSLCDDAVPTCGGFVYNKIGGNCDFYSAATVRAVPATLSDPGGIAAFLRISTPQSLTPESVPIKDLFEKALLSAPMPLWREGAAKLAGSTPEFPALVPRFSRTADLICPTGYRRKLGFFQHIDLVTNDANTIQNVGIEECTAECEKRDKDCESFEYSVNKRHCILQASSYATSTRFDDFVLCMKADIVTTKAGGTLGIEPAQKHMGCFDSDLLANPETTPWTRATSYPVGESASVAECREWCLIAAKQTLITAENADREAKNLTANATGADVGPAPTHYFAVGASDCFCSLFYLPDSMDSLRKPDSQCGPCTAKGEDPRFPCGTPAGVPGRR